MKFNAGSRVVANTFLITTYGDHDEIDAMPGALGVILDTDTSRWTVGIYNVKLDDGTITIAHESELDAVH
jgi:hypothetical protein